ncbi:UNVERIFIED_CONTAM: hypothetical protein Sangu_2332700 [Sesamum angustifolium]|uniref:Uncharacterized protein n=1 Tax=Sesamum angustifolium TaxID=2727405 RepID=A0AAW2L7P6_9LAMI
MMVSQMMVQSLALLMSVQVHIVLAVAPTIMSQGWQTVFLQCSAAADHPLWNGCTQSQLGVVAELVDIKTDGHISERIYDRISQWANRIISPDHTLAGDYYNTKKVINDLGLPIEKIDVCKDGCMLYLKDNVNLEYCKFCGNARYQLSQGRDPRWKKSPYAVLSAHHFEIQLGHPVNQMEVFEKVYKKKEDEQWSGDVLEVIEECQRQQNNNEEPAPLSQASVALNEHQLWMSVVGGQKRGRVFSPSSEAHHMIAGPSHPNSSTAPMPSPPQPERDDLCDLV